MDEELESEPPMPNIRWHIGRQGRGWSGEEARQRWELTPEKFEMNRGKLFRSDAERLAPAVGERRRGPRGAPG